MNRWLSRWNSPARGAPWKARRAAWRAFTLVELMVVVLIIAVLITLLSLFVTDGLERAKATHCRNNLRQFGVAIAKYKSDCDGFFMEGGGGAGTGPGSARAMLPVSIDHVVQGSEKIRGLNMDGIEVEGGINVSRHRDGIQDIKGSAQGFAAGGSYAPGFISGYVLPGGDARILHCPKVDQRIFDSNSPYFKGFSISTETIDYDTITSYNLDTDGQSCSYAWGPYLEGRPHEGVVAFVDWNAAQGWGASIGALDDYENNLWVMDRKTVGVAVQYLYGNAGEKKGAQRYRTEIGFHHRVGSNYYANYVAVDGHVGSIASNAPYVEFRKIFVGR